MTIKENHTAKKISGTTKRKAALRRGHAQKKDIKVLLKTAEDNDYINSMTGTLKGRVIFRSEDVRRARTLKLNSERNYFIHHLLIDRIKEGIEATAFEVVTDAYNIPMTEGYRIMSIPQSTYRRRLEKGKLLPDESDRVYRYAELMTQATEMMQEDSDRAATWFKTPLDILGGEAPLQHAMTEVGAREVEDLIGRIRHGVFS